MRTPASPFARVFFLVALLTTVFSSACSHTANIQTDPPGATVTKDGEVVGTTPVDVPIKVGVIDGAQTFTVTKDDATRTVRIDNDQFMWNQLIVNLGVGALGVVMIGAGAAIGLTAPAIGFPMLLSGVLITGIPVVSFFLAMWRVPDTVNISLRDDSVEMSSEADYAVTASIGRIGGPSVPASNPGPRKKRDEAPSPTPTEGTAGGACYGNGTCNAGLSCTDNICRQAADGSEGGRCYGNGTCNAGLSCVDATCVAE